MQMNVQNISFKIIIQTLLMQILLLFLGVSILDVDVSFMLRGVSGFLVVAFYKFLLCATLFHDKDLSVAFFFAVLFNVSRNFAVKSLSLLLCVSASPAAFLSSPTPHCTNVNLDRREWILGPSEHSEAGTSAFLMDGQLD